MPDDAPVAQPLISPSTHLRYYADATSQQAQREASNVDPVDGHAAPAGLHQPQQRDEEAALARACAAHNRHARPGAHLYVDAPQDQRAGGGVAQLKEVKEGGTILRLCGKTKKAATMIRT